jgi:uncharacterized RDD family membrane protein YckC
MSRRIGMTADGVEGRSRPVARIWLVPEEARAYQGSRAGIVSRGIANGIDLAVLMGVLGAIYLGSAGLAFVIDPVSFRFPMPSRPVALTVAALIAVLYFTGCWIATGRTYGDHVLGLRVVDHRGRRLRPGIALMRAVFCTFFMLGILWVAISAGRRSVQDIVLRTSVIYDWDPHSAPRSDAELAPDRPNNSG